MNKWLDYFTSRFPIFPLALFCTFSIAGVTKLSQGIFISLDMAVLSILYLLFLFHLRILDEFKDFKYDSINHKNRPIQKGLITLRQLAIVGIVNALLMWILVISTTSGHALILFIIAFLYTFLMFKEFFVKDLYRKSTVRYLVLHELVFIPLFLFYFSSLDSTVWIPQSIQDIAAFVYIILPIIIVEIGRKMTHRFTPRGEKTDDTYVYVWGERPAILVFSGLILLSGIVSTFIDLFSPTATAILFVSSAILIILGSKSPPIIMRRNVLLTVLFALGLPLLLLL